MQFQKFTPKTKQLAKILSGRRSSQIVDLTQKLRERPTPKFYRRGASCAGANVSRTSLIIAVSINGECLYLTIYINGCQMLGEHNSIYLDILLLTFNNLNT
jgi:hypothetical protein